MATGGHILVADDERNLRKLLRNVLEGSGYTVAEAANGVEALDQVRAGGIDLVILDGEAAPAGGMGVCRALKDEVYRCPPVLVLTARPQDAWLATWSRADAAVPHPIDPVVLGESVNTVTTYGYDPVTYMQETKVTLCKISPA